MELHAVPILKQMRTLNKSSFTDSPYMTLNKTKLAQLRPNKRSMADVFDQQSIPMTTEVIKPEQTGAPLKRHNFKIHTFKGLNWCEVCAHFLWGFTFQGVKCEGMMNILIVFYQKWSTTFFCPLSDCGFISHGKCSELVQIGCEPELKAIRGIFGIDLTATVKANNNSIPFVITRCIDEIEARGMNQEGIYRVSGFADEIEDLKNLFDKEGDRANISGEAHNINAIAGVLKLYLRLLPVPLITFDLYANLMETNSNY